MTMQVLAAAATHTGLVREHNEDALHHGRTVHAVADGLGGHAAGEVASAMAIETIARLDEQGLGHDVDEVRQALVDAVELANRRIHDDSVRHADRAGMGTTLTVAAVHEGALLLAHVGDSRAYLVRDGETEQVTDDHAIGGLITEAVGTAPEVTVDTYGPTPLRPGDRMVLCSDGLTAVVADHELSALATAGDPQAAADALVDETLRRGAPDNVAVVVIAAE